MPQLKPLKVAAKTGETKNKMYIQNLGEPSMSAPPELPVFLIPAKCSNVGNTIFYFISLSPLIEAHLSSFQYFAILNSTAEIILVNRSLQVFNSVNSRR